MSRLPSRPPPRRPGSVLRRPQTAPTLDTIAALAEDALTEIPPELRQLAEGVVIRVDDFPDDATIEEMELEGPFDLLGLYVGVPFGHADGATSRSEGDMIFLYRRPILDYWCETGEDLAHLVRHVLIHEIGHHFGLSDDDMEAIEDAS
ncbi:MAG: metallopeptidase family protein [Rhodospirillaceae bacterium]|nr:metallopeptidase family protein [Rhodospirillaceae bacterium]MCA8932702.1 metallopeptidase family protein [Rhodospirillaceae bacterium]